MLRITVPGQELYDEAKNLFFTTKDEVLEMEHSLASLSKWEEIWEKPFLEDDGRTDEETLSYIKCMLLSREYDPDIDEILSRLSADNLRAINKHIGGKKTATWFTEKEKKTTKKEVITAEVIYYWMVSLGIPFECQYWHLNRLFTLVKVCNEKNQPDKKRSKAEMIAERRALNAQRKAKLKTNG